MQQWGRWYSQAPVEGRYFRKQKKRFIFHRTKKGSHVRNGPPTHHGRRSAPTTTHRQNLYYIQQYSSAAVRTAVHLVRGEQLVGWLLTTLHETGNRRAGGHLLTILGHLGERASRRPPPTHHPPSTHGPTQYSSTAMQQYVEQYIHLTGEQQPIRWLQCFRAGRDLQLFTIPRHAGGQAKSARVADSAHGERRRLDAAVISPDVVLAVDAGALVVSCPWLCPWLKWPQSNSNVYYS